ncbi:hypothetical protein HY463_00235 [Candidatus Peregrinibacteria bacterium]|nr:hypothetical protein [Candidatus Peregrinibacteria bacterium]
MKTFLVFSLSLLILTACTSESSKKYSNPTQNTEGISERSTSTQNTNVPE